MNMNYIIFRHVRTFSFGAHYQWLIAGPRININLNPFKESAQRGDGQQQTDKNVNITSFCINVH